MKNGILFFFLIPFSMLFTSCERDAIIPEEKQYLFDGLPWYLTDTLFNYPNAFFSQPYSLEIDSKGIVWIQDIFKQLYRYDPEGKELIWWNTKEVLGMDFPDSPDNLFIDSKDRVWCNSHRELYLFEGTSVKTIEFPTVWGGNMAEDKEGNIHFHGSDSREYVCDGETVTDATPVFAPDDYLVYRIFNDNQKNLWYIMDKTIVDSYDKDIVKYCDADDYTLLPELPNKRSGGRMNCDNLAFDSNDNAYICSVNQIYRTGVNNNWESVCSWGLYDKIYPNKLYIDHDDNLWSALSYADGEADPKIIAVFKDGECITESLDAKVLQSRTRSVLDICFPDQNTVWICTTGGIFEFKK